MKQLRLPAAAGALAVALLWTGPARADHEYTSLALHISYVTSSPCNLTGVTPYTISYFDPRLSTVKARS